MTQGERKRRHLFKQGSSAFAKTRPDSHPGYACPLCRRVAPVVDPFSLEDVPPKSIGGKPILLTCTECNNTDGSKVDEHIALGKKAEEIVSGERAQYVKLSRAGHEVTARVSVLDGMIDVELDPTRSNPPCYDRFLRELKASVGVAKPDELEVRFTWKERHDPKKEAIAWLRVGYLFTFAIFGFRYILRPELEPIRRQIKNPGKRLLPELVRRVDQDSADEGVLLVRNPPRWHSIVVICRDRAILLPGFEHPSTFKSRMLGRRAWPTKFTGMTFSLPTRPVYLLDHDPSKVGNFLPAGVG